MEYDVDGVIFSLVAIVINNKICKISCVFLNSERRYTVGDEFKVITEFVKTRDYKLLEERLHDDFLGIREEG
mgnify:CR=1 FL=1|tara:strand:+ start:425 stop:640 length:216 start_codon:yes stop_codon:yes gene_type:complete